MHILHSPALKAPNMMMVRGHSVVVALPAADINALHESVLCKHLETAVDGAEANMRQLAAYPAVHMVCRRVLPLLLNRLQQRLPLARHSQLAI